MKVLLIALASLLLATVASAQVVVDPLVAAVDFISIDQQAATLTWYQGFVYPAAADVSTAPPLITGTVAVPKALAVVNPAGTARRLTFAQLGLTAIPACTVVAPATCPAYTIVIIGIGPGGQSPKTLASESDSFMRASLAAPLPPAAPSTVRIVP